MRFDCTDLANEWDHMESIRSRLREGGKLLPERIGDDPTIKQIVANQDVVHAILGRFVGCGLKLPDINPLREQVSNMYVKCNRQIGEDEVDDDAWDIRGMLRMIKRKAGRGEVSMDTLLNLKHVVHFWYLWSF